MNEIIQKVLDLPGQVAGRVLGSRVGDTLDGFDSNDGVRSYFQTIYSILAVAMAAYMLVDIIDGAGDFFSNADGMGIAGSIVTTLICLVAAFAISNVIRVRGDGFAGGHSSMVEFLAKDVMRTNIRLVGELGALFIFTQALCMAVATIFGATVYAPLGGGSEIVGALTTPVTWVSDAISAQIPFDFNSLYAVGSDAGSFSGAWEWDHVVGVFSTMVNAIMFLATFYVYLAIYNVGYNVVSWVAGWIQNPHLPIKNG
jgi:hypothetical protein